MWNLKTNYINPCNRMHTFCFFSDITIDGRSYNYPGFFIYCSCHITSCQIINIRVYRNT